jgi:transcriptional regulator with XRE-family HTH domain
MLRYARRRAGLSQRALGLKAGVAQSAIARIERGGVSPRVDTLERLLAETGATLEPMPRIGEGVDRSLIRAALNRTPEERVAAAGVAGRNVAVFLGAVRRGRRP